MIRNSSQKQKGLKAKPNFAPYSLLDHYKKMAQVSCLISYKNLQINNQRCLPAAFRNALQRGIWVNLGKIERKEAAAA
jgi:hypothetical protein